MIDRDALPVANFSGDRGALFSTQLRTLGYFTAHMEGEAWLRQPLDHSIVILDMQRPDENKAIAKAIVAKKLRVFCIYLQEKDEYLNPVLDCCSDFVFWPCLVQELTTRLDRFRNQHRKLSANPAHADSLSRTMLGSSKVFLMLLDKVRRVADCDAPVLISGETGTGKELAARAIHYKSSRADQPFIPVNCGALPDSLLENELFGHEQGAYTDARTTHAGLVAQADGGTLFLDEIDALTPKAQVTLLRFLQEQEYRPLGGKAVKKANIRIISASNKNLEERVRQGEFRDDLFFRLNIVPLRMPSLRERRGDIRVLAEYFLQKFRAKYNDAARYLPEESYQNLEHYDWPGNVRELEAVIHREFLMAMGDKVAIPRLGSESGAADTGKVYGINLEEDFNNAKSLVVNEFERQYLTLLMEEHHGNVTSAARHAGKERRALGKLLKKHGISKPSYL